MAVKRNRKMIRTLLTKFHIDDLTIGEGIALFNEYLQAYGDAAVFDACDYADSGHIAIYQCHLETDEEMAERILREEKQEKIREERDRADYERLKAKFG